MILYHVCMPQVNEYYNIFIWKMMEEMLKYGTWNTSFQYCCKLHFFFFFTLFRYSLHFPSFFFFARFSLVFWHTYTHMYRGKRMMISKSTAKYISLINIVDRTSYKIQYNYCISFGHTFSCFVSPWNGKKKLFLNRFIFKQRDHVYNIQIHSISNWMMLFVCIRLCSSVYTSMFNL